MIKKSKIQQVWDKNHDNVIKYTQVITNSNSNKEVLVEAETLNDLIHKVKSVIITLKNDEETL